MATPMKTEISRNICCSPAGVFYCVCVGGCTQKLCGRENHVSERGTGIVVDYWGPKKGQKGPKKLCILVCFQHFFFLKFEIRILACKPYTLFPSG